MLAGPGWSRKSSWRGRPHSPPSSAAAKPAAVEQAAPPVALPVAPAAGKAADQVDKKPAEPAAGSKVAAKPASPEIVVADNSIKKPEPSSAAVAIDHQVEAEKQVVEPAVDQPALEVAKVAKQALSDEAGGRVAAMAADHGIAKADARRPAGSAKAAVEEDSAGGKARGPRLVDLVTPSLARAIGGNDKSFELSHALAFEDPQLELAGSDAKDFSRVSSAVDAMLFAPAAATQLVAGKAVSTPSEPDLSPTSKVVTEYEDDDFDGDDGHASDHDHEFEHDDEFRSSAVVEDSPMAMPAQVSRNKPAKSDVARPSRKQLKAQRDFTRALKRSQKAKSVAQLKSEKPSVANAIAAPAKKKVARSSAGLQLEKAKPVAKVARIRVAAAAAAGRVVLKSKRTARTMKQKAAKKRLLLVGFISGRDRGRGGRGHGGGGDDHSGRGRGSDGSGGSSGSSNSGSGGNSGKGGGDDESCRPLSVANDTSRVFPTVSESLCGSARFRIPGGRAAAVRQQGRSTFGSRANSGSRLARWVKVNDPPARSSHRLAGKAVGEPTVSNSVGNAPVCEGRLSASTARLVEMVVDRLCHLLADALHCHQVGHAGAGHCLGRAEVFQQRAFALGADAGDLVERVGGISFLRLARWEPIANRWASSRNRWMK